MTPSSFRIAAIDTFVLRAPIDEPVRTSFGIMRDRPALLVRVTESNGICGWGEIWCNFPSCGAEHRARLVSTEIAPRLSGCEFSEPKEVYDELSSALHLLALQSGEHGPLAQIAAGIDQALWDIYARLQSKPLWKLLGGKRSTVAAYASGINPTNATATAAAAYDQGYRAFKLKVGFDDDLDIANVQAIRDELGYDIDLMVDANQGWTLDQAINMSKQLADFQLRWIEEPLPVDADSGDWKKLATASTTPLAGGENLNTINAYRDAINSGVYGFLQPDLGKWGGVSACVELASEAQQAGICYCPHWLGGAIGLMTSAHLLAAIGGDGYLEVDCNPNPLRDKLVNLPAVKDSAWSLDESVGIGVVPNPECLNTYQQKQTD